LTLNDWKRGHLSRFLNLLCPTDNGRRQIFPTWRNSKNPLVHPGKLFCKAMLGLFCESGAYREWVGSCEARELFERG
jgi:hypothetical protein